MTARSWPRSLTRVGADLAECREILTELAMSPVEQEHRGYYVIQIDRPTWEQLQAWRRGVPVEGD